MRKIKLRIGTKLGISAGLGIVLVAGMIANDQISNRAQSLSATEAETGKAVMLDSLASRSAVQGSQLAMNHARYGRTTREIDRAVASLDSYGKSGNAHLDAAIAKVTEPEARERLTKIKARFADSLKAAAEIASKQKQIVGLENQRAEATDKWTRAVEGLLGQLAADTSGEHAKLEAMLRSADSMFKDARLAALQFQLTGDEVLMAQIMRAGDEATSLLRNAQQAAGDALKPKIGELTQTIDNFRQTLEQIVDIEESKVRTVRLRTNIIADEIMDLIDKAVTEATERSNQTEAQAGAALTQAGRIAVAIGVGVIAILLGSALLSMFSIARPIRRIGDVLLELANGNKEVTIPYTKRTDEVGDTARVAETFRDQLVRMEQLEAEQKEVERRAAEERKAEMHELANAFETAVGNSLGAVTRAAADLEAAAGTLTGTAESTQQLSGNVARVSEEASYNVHSVAAASDELSSSVSEIARQVQESSRIAAEAVTQAEQTDTRIGQLLQAASRIGDVVKLITAIAEQTNLLALNATIEAARAGDAGRGFAVVAQEVKALAAQTAKATDEIGGQIHAIQDATRDSVSAIKEIGATINRISEIATAVAAAVEEQGAATQEISRNAQQAAEGTAQAAGNIADVNRAATETGTASGQVLSSAQALSREGEMLREEVDRFLATVRAA
jgi:methyl-accepting chemotaxis protein